MNLLGGAAALALATMLAFDCAGSASELPWREAKGIWTARLGERPSGGPWLFRNFVLYFTYSGKLTALSAATGETLWQTKTEGPEISAPTLHEGVVYVGAHAKGLFMSGGQLIAVDAATGAVHWSSGTSTRPLGRALITGDSVLARMPNHWVALHRTTGKELWRSGSAGEGTMEPVIAGSAVLLPEYNARLRAVDAGTGKVKWQFLASAKAFPQGEIFAREAFAAVEVQTPDARQFFVATSPREIYLYGIAVCRAALQRRTEDQILGDVRQFLGGDAAKAILIAARKALCPEGTSMDQVMDLANAANVPIHEGVSSGPTVLGDRVFVRTRIGDDSYAIYILDLDSGAVLSRLATTYGGSPVGDNQTVYFIAMKEKRAELHAVEISTGKPLWVADLSRQRVDSRARLVLSETLLYARNAQIDRKTGMVEWPMPFDVERPAEAPEPDCFMIRRGTGAHFISMFDFVNAKVRWAFRVDNLKNPGFRVACGESTAFFYEDWDDYPVFGAQLQ